jgi:hypothetical protein
MKRLAFAAMLLASPAIAQDAAVETVNAYGNSMVGVWRVSQPGSIAVTGFFSPIIWGRERQHYCRIAAVKDVLQASCSTGGLFEAGTVTVEDNHVHFAWGTMLLRMVLDGELQDRDHFSGRFQIKVSGITAESPTSYDSMRVLPDADAPDGGSMASLLRRILDQGFFGVPQDADAMRKNESNVTLPKLGAIRSIAYLGQETKPSPPGTKPISSQPDFFSVYFVRFADGERLCRLHQREDGVLDAFRCV